jgi:hypothetical protein
MASPITPPKGVFQPHPNDAWQSKYPGIVVDEYRIDARMVTEIRARLSFSVNHQLLTWEWKKIIADSELVRGPEPPEIRLSKHAERTVEELIASLPEEVIGKYPFTRLYHDLHILDDVGRHRPSSTLLWGHPDREVPGWVHDRFRHQKYYPKDKTITPVPLTLEGESTGVVLPDDPIVPPSRVKQFQEPDNHKELVAAMATKTAGKRKTVSKIDKPLVDPNKIKKPSCSEHEVKMQFDPVENKWRCTIPGCNKIKRPKRDDDSKRVVLGKGSVQLRLIQDGEQTTVILISDDNVALDITKFVDVERLIENADITTLAQEADELGHYNFTVGSEYGIPMKMNIVVMGVPDVVKNYG